MQKNRMEFEFTMDSFHICIKSYHCYDAIQYNIISLGAGVVIYVYKMSGDAILQIHQYGCGDNMIY